MLGYTGEHSRVQAHKLESADDSGQPVRILRDAQRRLIDAYLAGYRPKDWPGSDGYRVK